jgi:hypothetical protein
MKATNERPTAIEIESSARLLSQTSVAALAMALQVVYECFGLGF